MGIEPDQGQAVLPGRQTFDCADVGATAAAEDERTFGQVGGECKILLLQGVGLDDPRLGLRQLEPRCLRHRLAALAPRLRYAHQPRAKDAPARMALVFRPERYRGVRPAVRALRPQTAHARSFS